MKNFAETISWPLVAVACGVGYLVFIAITVLAVSVERTGNNASQKHN